MRYYQNLSFIMFVFLLVIFLRGITNVSADLLDVELFLEAMTEMDHNS
jgi:hypothetical protein